MTYDSGSSEEACEVSGVESLGGEPCIYLRGDDDLLLTSPDRVRPRGWVF